MRAVFALFLIVGIGLAGTAAYMIKNMNAGLVNERDRMAQALQKVPKTVSVVVATKSLRYGERFTRDDLEVIRVQAGKVPDHTFRYISAAAGTPEAKLAVFLEGETRPRAALRSLETYEPIIGTKVTAPGVDAGIASSLPPGSRAFTISVNVTSGVSGFLRPGDLVDVYWSGEIRGRTTTKLLETNLKLIAIDQISDTDRESETQVARSVTAEVTPEQVAALTLAQSTGNLTLALVGTEGAGVPGPIEIDRNALLGITTNAAPAEPAPRVCTIRTRKGDTVYETPIPCTN